MKCVIFAILLCCLFVTAQHANAGAWPRGKGKTFSASSAILTWPDGRTIDLPDIYGSTYLEYGISPRLTMGLDMGSPDATRPDRLKTVGFLRYTLTGPNKTHQFAIDVGGGRYLGPDVFRLGISYGLGFQSFSKNSWVAVDAHALRTTTGTQTAYVLDATYGISLKRGKLMAQVSAFHAFDNAKSLNFAPSYALDLGRKRHLEVGVIVGLRGKPDPTLKVGIWQDF